MLDTALKLLNRIEDAGFKAYIVGGFVRDYLLGIQSNDVDIATNAKPKDLLEIFEDACLPTEDYGNVTVMSKKIHFEITTFRKEISYKDHRRPVEIEYIDDLHEDLERRDFTINTICINKDGEVIDYLNGQDDLHKKIVTAVGSATKKFTDDCLRILRAIRISVKLGFTLSDEVIQAIHETKVFLNDLSYNRKREELDKIFTCGNAKAGIELLMKLNLSKELGISNFDKVQYTDSLMGVWAVLEFDEAYPFTNNEKDLIKDIREAKDLNNLDPYVLYQYGLYVNSVAGPMNGISNKEITEAYNGLAIHDRSDLDIKTEDILIAIKKEAGPYLKDIYVLLEKGVLYKTIKNEKAELLSYCIANYQDS